MTTKKQYKRRMVEDDVIADNNKRLASLSGLNPYALNNKKHSANNWEKIGAFKERKRIIEILKIELSEWEYSDIEELIENWE